MTREEADELQSSLDKYVELRDSDSGREIRWGNRVIRDAPKLMKMQLAQIIERLIPEVSMPGTKDGEEPMDITALFGPLLGIFSKHRPMKDCNPFHLQVVDGAPPLAERENPDDVLEEYCICIPADIWHEALMVRSSVSFSRSMYQDGFDVGMSNEKKGTEK